MGRLNMYILQSVIYRVYKRSIFPVKCKPTIIYTSEPNGAEPQHKVGQLLLGQAKQHCI
jgi:hypothetical protein